MKHRGPVLAILLLCALLAACARPQVILDRVVLRNATPATLTDVEVRHEPTLRFGSVGMLLPGTSYEIAFSGQPMLATRAVIGWQDETGRRWSVTVPLPQASSMTAAGQAVSLVYEIGPAGQVTVALQPKP